MPPRSRLGRLADIRLLTLTLYDGVFWAEGSDKHLKGQTLAWFFDEPHKPPSRHRTSEGIHSVLYILRRNIIQCFNTRIVQERQLIDSLRQGHAKLVWPGLMTICAGIDLLAKFHVGSDGRGKGMVRDRFLSYVQHYLYPLDEAQREALWGVRCSLMHSFGLYDPEKQKPIAVDEAFPDEGCVSETEEMFALHYKSLFRDFVYGIHGLYGELLGNSPETATRLERFKAMYPRYGILRISGRLK